MRLEAVDTHALTWRAALDELYQQLGGSGNPTLLPYHFLQAAFPHIGGQLFRLLVDGQVVAILFLLPHPAPVQEDVSAAPEHDEQAQISIPAYIARCHYLTTTPTVEPLQLQALLAQTLNSAKIWGSPAEYLYPVDIHSSDFPLGTTLVARVNETVAGFLFGFYKANGLILPSDWQARWHGELRIESQVMGVLPEHRGLRIGYLLKRIQAEQALAEGIGIIHWTVDPLQYPNAALNFGLLRAVAFNFTPDYYAFRNELNRGPASRFSLTWLIGSARVQGKPLHDARSAILPLAQHPEIIRVNNGWQQADFSATAPMLAIEIPSNWTELQKANPDEALEWRATTDRLFSHYIGNRPGKYVVTDVGVDGEHRYLIIQQVTDYLWQRLEET